MAKIDIYTKPWCTYSERAVNMLTRRGLAFNEINTSDTRRQNEMKKRSGRNTVPQIFINHVHIGGSDDLFLADKSGLLAELVSSENRAT